MECSGAEEFSNFCWKAITECGSGQTVFESLGVLDPKGNLVSWLVIRKRGDDADADVHLLDLPSPRLNVYRKVCGLVFGNMCLAVDFPPVWTLTTPTEYDRSPLKGVKRRPLPATVGIRTKRRRAFEPTDDDGGGGGGEYSNPRLCDRRDAVTVESFRRHWEIVGGLVKNMREHGAVVWGMTEVFLKRGNPFRYMPLFPYDMTVAQWLRNSIDCSTLQLMAEQLSTDHEAFLCGSILYRGRNFVIAKKHGVIRVHRTDDEDAAADDGCCGDGSDDAVPIALFFNVYAGGHMGRHSQIRNEKILQSFLSGPVSKVVLREEEEGGAETRTDVLARYRRALEEVTRGETKHDVMKQFRSVGDLTQYAIVDGSKMRFHVPVEYVHPETHKTIALAVKFESNSEKVLCRWTDVVSDPPDRHYASDPRILRALTRSSRSLVDVSAVTCLRRETETWSFEDVVSAFCDATLDSTATSSSPLPSWYASYSSVLTAAAAAAAATTTTFPDLFATDAPYYDDEKKVIDLKKTRFLMGLARGHRLYQASSLYRRVGETKQRHLPIVYGDYKFALAYHGDFTEEETTLLASLNSDAHRRILYDVTASSDGKPSVGDLCRVNPKVVELLNEATGGTLAPFLPQAEYLCRQNDDLAETIRNLFAGSWAYAKAERSLRETLHVTCATRPRENPFYIINTKRGCFMLVNHDHEQRVYESTSNDNDWKIHDDSTRTIERLDVVSFAQSSLGEDVTLTRHLITYLYINREKNRKSYGKLLSFFKKDLVRLSDFYYARSVVGAKAFRVLSRPLGERMLTALIEKQLFSTSVESDPHLQKRQQQQQQGELNVVTFFKNEFSGTTTITNFSDCGSTLFSSVDPREPVLFLYGTDRSAKTLRSLAFNRWLGSKNGRVGFLVLPRENIPKTSDDMSDPPVAEHALTLVATQELFHEKSEELVWPNSVMYGPSDTALRYRPDMQNQLIHWLEGGPVDRIGIANSVSWHSSILKSGRLGSGERDARLFDPGFSGTDKLTNSLPEKEEESFISDYLRRLSFQNYSNDKNYARLPVTTVEFDRLFPKKIVTLKP